MRIIGGTHRSRQILPPKDPRKGGTTRPITDRVKQSLFDRLVAMEALGGNALDLFAGTGSLGLEALSRGTDHCTFVERDRAARQLLEQNLAELGLAQRASVLGLDALSLSWINILPHKPVRLALCDPPYKMTDEVATQPRIAALIAALLPAMEEEGVLVLRTSDRAPAPAVEGWNGPESHNYGSMTLHFYQKAGAREERA